MKTTTEILINGKVEDVWEIMGNQFAQVDKWSSNFFQSKAGGETLFEGLSYSHRDTITERGQTVQVLDLFDFKNYALSYHITIGMPPIASEAKARWWLSDIDGTKTNATFVFEMKPKNFLISIISPLIKRKISSAGKLIAAELKYFIEHKEAHPRNLKTHK
jgi:hypothetical protein